MSGSAHAESPSAPSYSQSGPEAGGVRGLWRTPRGVWLAPLTLLGRTTYDLDAASDNGPDITVPSTRRLIPADDALVNAWFSEPIAMDTPLLVRPLVWLNPPFGKGWGGKREWVAAARDHALNGALVAFYCPAYGDRWADDLEAEALTTIRMGGGRVRHVPPQGVLPSSPGPVAHRIWLLGPPHLRANWDLHARLVWNHRLEGWIRPLMAPPWYPALAVHSKLPGRGRP